MFSNFRSLLFKIDPETAHTLAIKSLKFNFIPEIFDENSNDPLFSTNLLNKDIANPIGMAAGFDKNAEVYNSLFKLGFGFVEVGTVTPMPQYGNPKPRVFRLVEDEALINRLGFNNKGSESAFNRINNNPKRGVLGINIGPNKDTNDRLNDYLIGLEKFHNLADYITINISSPNTENLRNFHDESKLDDLLSRINAKKKELNSKVPLVVKISPDLKDTQIEDIANILLSNKIEAAIISNTSDSTREDLKDIQKHQKGGLSGKPIEKKSNTMIKKFYKYFNKKIKIIGVGGVDSGESACEKFLAGADYIQLYTGMVYQGPNIVSKIKKELKEILNKKGVKNYSEIVGNHS
jgi:dihydroorotate dehydrogenase